MRNVGVIKIEFIALFYWLHYVYLIKRFSTCRIKYSQCNERIVGDWFFTNSCFIFLLTSYMRPKYSPQHLVIKYSRYRLLSPPGCKVKCHSPTAACILCSFRLQNNIKVDVTEIGSESEEWIQLVGWRALFNNYQLLK
jgi:hypothetical protein